MRCRLLLLLLLRASRPQRAPLRPTEGETAVLLLLLLLLLMLLTCTGSCSMGCLEPHRGLAGAPKELLQRRPAAAAAAGGIRKS